MSEEITRDDWRHRLHEIVFEADTPAGRWFDVLLFAAILLSVTAVALESVTSIREAYGTQLVWLEWSITVFFTIEYVVRLLTVKRPASYAFSFFGLVDLFSIVPTWVSLFLPGAQSLLVIRVLRLLRVFRVLKLSRFIREARYLRTAMRASGRKIIIFIGAVLTVVVIVGAAMYMIEGAEHGFTSIPTGMYWAIVTMTTVGYGDIAPGTVPGKILASVLMILGYGIIAVPTGIVTAEMTAGLRRPLSTQSCRTCASEDHENDAKFCRHCGDEL